MVFPYMKNRIILTDIGLPHVHSLLCLQDDCKFREKLVEELVSIVIPVSYTHLDVYKRQVFILNIYLIYILIKLNLIMKKYFIT